SQRFCQAIGHHILRWTIFQPCRAIFNAVSDEVILNIDVLCTGVVFRIVCGCDSALIVGVDDVLIADAVADFSEKTEEPYLLLRAWRRAMYSDSVVESANEPCFFDDQDTVPRANVKTNPDTDSRPSSPPQFASLQAFNL